MMTTVLTANASARLMRWTGVCAGVLVALYIAFEAPLSGMSLNPARSVASAVPSGIWHGIWIYLIAAAARHAARRRTARAARAPHALRQAPPRHARVAAFSTATSPAMPAMEASHER